MFFCFSELRSPLNERWPSWNVRCPGDEPMSNLVASRGFSDLWLETKDLFQHQIFTSKHVVYPIFGGGPPNAPKKKQNSLGEKEDLRRILPRLFTHAGVSLQDIDSVCEEVENLMGDNAGWIGMHLWV